MITTGVGFLDRLLGRRGRMSLATAPEGTEVRVSGTVSCESPLVAPYTGRPCVYWRLEMLQQQLDATTTGTTAQAIDFTIDDGSGRADVIVERCEFDVVSNYVEMERASRLSRKANELVVQFGWGPFAEIAQINVREAIVGIGDDIEIVGVGVREPELHERGERGYRDAVPASKLVFSGHAKVRGKQRDAVFLKSP